MLMMGKLNELDQITTKAFIPTKTLSSNGQFKLVTSAQKEQCVMDNITPLKKAILKILLYSDLLIEKADAKEKKAGSTDDASLFSYFDKQEIPVMEQVSLALSEALMLLKIGLIRSSGIKTGQAVQKVIDIRLTDYGVDAKEDQKLDKVDMVQCGQYWYEGVQEIQELDVADQAMDSEEAPESGNDKWVEITKRVRKKCLETVKSL